MNTTFQQIVHAQGLTAAKASQISGIPYITILQHLKGTRGISPQLAQQYQKKLGIPLSSLRPDLWPPEPSPAQDKA